MKIRRFLGALCFTVALLVLAGSASAGNALILNVPDWDQPDDYAPVGGMVVGDAPSWCSPTSGANLMGYWEDQRGYNGLTDGMAWGAVPNSPAFPNPANGQWMQNNWHDCTIEMGFFMDSGTWATRAVNPGVWPPGAGWTQLNNIGPGAATFAGWKGYPNIPFSKDQWLAPLNQAQAQAIWNAYVADIDAGEPVLCSFDVWVTPGVVGAVVVNEQTVAQHDFAEGTSPHTVVGVGYLDANTAALGDEWFITQDNKPWTGPYVAVPYNWPQTEWRQNDYVAIPEPASAMLLVIALPALIRRRRSSQCGN